MSNLAGEYQPYDEWDAGLDYYTNPDVRDHVIDLTGEWNEFFVEKYPHSAEIMGLMLDGFYVPWGREALNGLTIQPLMMLKDDDDWDSHVRCPLCSATASWVRVPKPSVWYRGRKFFGAWDVAYDYDPDYVF